MSKLQRAAHKAIPSLLVTMACAASVEASEVRKSRKKVQDLGKLGPLYPIKEQDIIDQIQNELKSAEFQKKLKIVEKERLTNAKKYAKEPTGAMLPRAKENRRSTYDPSITAQTDIRDASGKVLVAKGTSRNPLDFVSIPDLKLCFIDANDRDQVEWLKSNCSPKPSHKIILTSGSPLKLSKEIKWRVYFDQGGAFITKFGIQALPASVTPGRKVLYVDEYAI